MKCPYLKPLECMVCRGCLLYTSALAKREGVPFCAKLDLPQVLPVDEIDLCLVLSNLLENAFEASLRLSLIHI